MKTPAFWSEPNFLSRLLKPLGAAYAFATRLRIGWDARAKSDGLSSASAI